MLKVKLFAASICLLLTLSCSQQQLISANGTIRFDRVINDYNKDLSPGESTINEAIAINGRIKVLQSADQKMKKLTFQVYGHDYQRKYEFLYDLAVADIDIPASIRAGKLVFLGDNLVIFDAEKQRYYSFVIGGSKNRVPELQPINDNGIGLVASTIR